MATRGRRTRAFARRPAFGAATRPKRRPVTPLGTTFDKRQVAFTKRQRLHHTHVIGSTGTGKSKFLEQLLRHDIQDRSCGVCLLDPHGSLYDDVVFFAANRCPHLADRFVLFDPARSTDFVLGFNPIPSDAKNSSDYVVEMLVSACLKAWGQDNMDRTPRITRWLENSFQTIIDNDLTLAETLPLLSTTDRFRKECQHLVSHVENQAVVEDWEMFRRSNNLQRQNLVEGASNRLRKFLRSRPIRSALGQQQHVLDLASIMDEGKILLVNLNGGNTISGDNTKLLGIMLVNELFRVAKLRDPRDPRLKPFFLYIDEFANFITRDIARALEECRKFGLFLTLAHQHLAQLREEDEYLYASVMTNCLNRVVFGGLSKVDASLMADEIATGFLNLKAIKDERYTTKVRHVEEERTTRGYTQGLSQSQSDANSTSSTVGASQGASQSQARSQGVSRSQSTSVTFTQGQSRGRTASEGHSRGRSRSMGRSEGQTLGETETDGRTMTTGHTESTGQTRTIGSSDTLSKGRSGGTSHQTGWSRTDTEGSSSSIGVSSGESMSQGYADTTNRTQSRRSDALYGARSDSGSSTRGEGHTNSGTTSQQAGSSSSSTDSRSRARGQSGSHTKTAGWSTGHAEGFSSSDGWTQTASASKSKAKHRSSARSSSRSTVSSHGVAETQSVSQSNGRSRTDSRSSGHTNGLSQGHSSNRTATTAESVSRSQSSSEGRSKTQSRSQSQSRTTTIVPFMRPVEYQELSARTFWTLPELQYMAMAAIKNQGVGVAFIKSGSSRPVQTRIQYVPSIPYHPTLSPKRLATFRANVIAAHPECYLPADEAHRQQHDRQLRVFQEPLLLEQPKEPAEVEVQTAAVPDNSDDNPFA